MLTALRDLGFAPRHKNGKRAFATLDDEAERVHDEDLMNAPDEAEPPKKRAKTEQALTLRGSKQHAVALRAVGLLTRSVTEWGEVSTADALGDDFWAPLG